MEKLRWRLIGATDEQEVNLSRIILKNKYFANCNNNFSNYSQVK